MLSFDQGRLPEDQWRHISGKMLVWELCVVEVPLQYVESVLETSGDDFESTDDLYEAIGEVGFSKSGREVDKVELLWNGVDCVEKTFNQGVTWDGGGKIGKGHKVYFTHVQLFDDVRGAILNIFHQQGCVWADFEGVEARPRREVSALPVIWVNCHTDWSRRRKK